MLEVQNSRSTLVFFSSDTLQSLFSEFLLNLLPFHVLFTIPHDILSLVLKLCLIGLTFSIIRVCFINDFANM